MRHDFARMLLHCLNHWKLETPKQKKLHSQGEDLVAYKQNYTRSVDITSLHRNQKVTTIFETFDSDSNPQSPVPLKAD